jgi:Oligonucleotide/oligosaccharide-binding (OB)-fold
VRAIVTGKTVGGVASSAGTNRAHFAVKDSPEAAFVHPSSVNSERFRNASEKGQKPVWILYHTKVKTKQVYCYTYKCNTDMALTASITAVR